MGQIVSLAVYRRQREADQIAALVAALLPPVEGRLFAVGSGAEVPALITATSREQLAAFLVDTFAVRRVRRFWTADAEAGSEGSWHLEVITEAGTPLVLELRSLPWLRLGEPLASPV
ncbi:MAG TPA: hypothetical protein VF234_02790 [Limnochordia bacterium]